MIWDYQQVNLHYYIQFIPGQMSFSVLLEDFYWTVSLVLDLVRLFTWDWHWQVNLFLLPVQWSIHCG